MQRLSPLLTDHYQFSMVYTYFTTNQHEKPAVYEMFFRTNPFKGTYAVFAGLGTLMEFLTEFRFTDEEITYLKKVMPQAEDAFFEYLKTLNPIKQLTVRAPREGTLVFGGEPLIIVEGPLGLCQLVETTLLVLVNYATLVCTNACRMRVAASHALTQRIRPSPEVINEFLQQKSLLEFGLRRAQGPNGGLSSSRYSLMGGFTATSNVQAAMQLDISPSGTMAHAFILSITKPLQEAIPDYNITQKLLKGHTFAQFAELILKWKEVLFMDQAGSSCHNLSMVEQLPAFNQYRGNQQELTAFAVFAFTQPWNFFALIDTYDTLNSGVPNFLIVACALMEYGIQPSGVRLDSGDLAYLSIECRKIFNNVDDLLAQMYERVTPNAEKITYNHQIRKSKICASNDITEEVLVQLHKDGAQIDIFGIGTHLVTCQAQPALGGVYKLVQIDGIARMKMTENIEKASLPGAKDVYRLYLQNGEPYVDYICQRGQKAPQVGDTVTCIHPHNELMRVMVKPSKVEKLHQVWIEGGELKYKHRVEDGKIILEHPPVFDIRYYVMEQVLMMREDHKRYLNPTPYKVSLSAELFAKVKEMALEIRSVAIVQ